MDEASTARVDSWLWAVRVFRTRSAATAACRAGHVRVGGDHVKAAYSVHVGDEVRVRIAGFDRVLSVSRLVTKHVAASVAAECMIDLTPARPPRESLPVGAMRDRGAGRPTKRDRREIDRLRGAMGGPRGS